jgi:hypothetical protein
VDHCIDEWLHMNRFEDFEDAKALRIAAANSHFPVDE